MAEIDASLKAFRASLLAQERAATAVMADHYGAALAAVQRDLDNALDSLRRFDDPADPSFDSRGRLTDAGWQRFKQRRLVRLLDLTEQEFTRYSKQATRVIDDARQHGAESGAANGRQLILDGLGTPPLGVLMPSVSINRQAVIDLAAAMQPDSPLGRVLSSFAGEARTDVMQMMASGAIRGQNSRVIAREMAKRLGVNLRRAEVISRTELHRAYRSSTSETLKANRRLLRGWTWSAARDRRSCAVCLALDGRLFDVDTPMRAHVACRCSIRPVTKSWGELGYDIPQPTPIRQPETGVDWFRRQPETIQREVLGPAAQAAYASGEVDLEDFIRLKRSRVWGSAYIRASLPAAQARAAERGRRAA